MVDALGIRDFLRSCSLLLKRAKRPGRREIWLLVKICAIGVLIVGIIGFVIRVVFFLFIPRG